MTRSTVSVSIALAIALAATVPATAQTTVSPLASAQSAQAAACNNFRSVLADINSTNSAAAAAQSQARDAQARGDAAGAQAANARYQELLGKLSSLRQTLTKVEMQYDMFAEQIYAAGGRNVCTLPFRTM